MNTRITNHLHLLPWLSLDQNLNAGAVRQSKVGHKGLPLVCQKGLACLALIVLSPLIILFSILIRLESKGGAFFTQVRIGENGRRFHCYKMRSMFIPSDPKFIEPQQSDREGVCKKFFNDPRITNVGRIIRKFSIDELPQLVNVIKGDMALIGPRPHLISEYDEYDANILPRLYCMPGITGLWQINGRADTDFDEQLLLDKTYINNQSAWLDFQILMLTIPAVINAKGAY